MNPSDFTRFPWNSVLQDSTAERIALNIMVILERTGNTFRPLTWEEYKTERLKDTDFSGAEEEYFTKVIGWCKNADTAQLFSKSWGFSGK